MRTVIRGGTVIFLHELNGRVLWGELYILDASFNGDLSHGIAYPFQNISQRETEIEFDVVICDAQGTDNGQAGRTRMHLIIRLDAPFAAANLDGKIGKVGSQGKIVSFTRE